ncbi:hypothetical protein H5410_047777 [Solanum commersonii]|uniref:Uncharacterized protein n=1 Tax=Solanum commersonii TaxID=4109 RepID=A0A9J5XIC4_SOLCO|nr:hypothetical protein H5410_047777 [Solanum commersonii]
MPYWNIAGNIKSEQEDQGTGEMKGITRKPNQGNESSGRNPHSIIVFLASVLTTKKETNTQSDEQTSQTFTNLSQGSIGNTLSISTTRSHFTSTNPTPIPPSSLSVPAAQNTPRTAQQSSDPRVGSHNVPYRIQLGADPSRSYRIVAIHHTCSHRSSDAAGF